MPKVHPNAAAAAESPTAEASCDGRARAAEATALTVWRKSLLFNGNGFTVFDSKGNLVFRVDNYSSGSSDEIVLMDAAGKPLLTIRKKRVFMMQKLSLGDQWLVYDREEAVNPRFAVKKHKVLLHSTKALARVTAPCTSGSKSRLVYDVEGSYSRRCCVVYDDRRRQLAEIKKKESAQGIALGLDVFRLIVEPELDAAFAMAMVILLEQMFGSRRSLLGEACVFMRL
ncbi:protein LURP-one-related 8 isoform X1 [Musa acuminata AAA Group]|uniref:protein LURP-one-related 8 isoform X1 n=1 Tax=Musa acuminata AAA Group TaxID=214697 RepID=UPI0031DD0B11